MYFVRYLMKYIKLCNLTFLNMHQNLKRKTDFRFESTKSNKVYLWCKIDCHTSYIFLRELAYLILECFKSSYF